MHVDILGGGVHACTCAHGCQQPQESGKWGTVRGPVCVHLEFRLASLCVLFHLHIRTSNFSHDLGGRDSETGKKPKLLNDFLKAVDLGTILIFSVLPKIPQLTWIVLSSKQNKTHDQVKPVSVEGPAGRPREHTQQLPQELLWILPCHLADQVWRTIKIKENSWMQLILFYSKWSILFSVLNDQLLHLNDLLETCLLMKTPLCFFITSDLSEFSTGHRTILI